MRTLRFAITGFVLGLCAVLVIASAGAQTFGPGLRYDLRTSAAFAAGVTNGGGAGGISARYVPPAAATGTVPTGDLWVHLDYLTTVTQAGLATWSDSSGNGNDFVRATGISVSTATAPLGVLTAAGGTGSGFFGWSHYATSPVQTSTFSVVLVGTPVFYGWGGGPSFFTCNSASGAATKYTWLVVPYAISTSVFLYDYWTGGYYPSGVVPYFARLTYVLTCDGATMTTYLNGSKTWENAQPPNVEFDSTAVGLNANLSQPTQTSVTNSYVEQFYVYTRCLTESEATGTAW